MVPSWSLNLLVANWAIGAVSAERPSQGWRDGKFKTLVTFGDSYTDENRLGYFINHNGSAPPVGWQQPVGLNTASGGLSWARYASIYSSTNLYNYAVSGAVCSNAITPRFFSAINAPFPDISSYELPAFLAETQYKLPNGTNFFTGKPDTTVYSIWIGTNDLGNNAFLTDSQVAGKTVKNYIDCVYATVDRLYAHGARYFVLLNLAPLDLLPQYALPQDGGLNATQYFPEKADLNATQISERMRETVAALNLVYAYRTPFDLAVEKHWPGAKVANFDVNALLTEVYYHPEQYLNGTAPLNVEGVEHPCDVLGQNCVLNESPDSYMWYDPLHPSEQTSRVVAREFVRVLGGRSRWARYWG